MTRHVRFEWHVRKNASNLRKHGVSFDDAARVLADPDFELTHIEEYDQQHSRTEDRWVTTGSDPFDRAIVILVAWTERFDEQGGITRIISARTADTDERNAYEIEIANRQAGF